MKTNLLKKICLESKRKKFISDYGNEFFLYYCVPAIEQEHFSVKKLPSKAKSTPITYLLYSIYFLLIFIPCVFTLIITLGIYLLIFKKKVAVTPSKSISVISSKAAWDKIKNQKIVNATHFFADDFRYKNRELTSLYSLPFPLRLKALISSVLNLPRELWVVYYDIMQIDVDNKIISKSLRLILRLPHKIIYENYLYFLIKEHAITELVSGNKEDRFALLEQRISSREGLQTICIPHGLEYGFKMPNGLFGDYIYCTSKKAQLILQDIYECQMEHKKFIYDPQVAENMFKPLKFICAERRRKVVFFPESREIEVNQLIISSLVTFNIDFSLKLHPSDNINNYTHIKKDINLIIELDEALNDSICLARKSTILLEALHRGSLACALLFNEKDRVYVEEVFPSLSDESIKLIYNATELTYFLKESQSV